MIQRVPLVLAALVGSLPGFNGDINGPLNLPLSQRYVAVPSGDHVVLHRLDGRTVRVPLDAASTDPCEKCEGFGVISMSPPPTKFTVDTEAFNGAKGNCEYFEEVEPYVIYWWCEADQSECNAWYRTTLTPTQAGLRIKITQGGAHKPGVLNQPTFWDFQHSGVCGSESSLPFTIEVFDAAGGLLETVTGSALIKCEACEGSGASVRPG